MQIPVDNIPKRPKVQTEKKLPYILYYLHMFVSVWLERSKLKKKKIPEKK